MEITKTLFHSCCSIPQLHTPPLLHFSSFSRSLPTNAVKNTRLLNFRKPLAVTDGGGSNATTEVAAAFDPSLALKKKATDISPELKGSSVFLVGMKSSVKTSLGKLLANVLRYYYFDSDGLVEEAAGTQPGAKSFREIDKTGFHESETEVLKQLSSMGRLVVCAGDGAVQNSTNLGLLRHGITIWIDVPLNKVAQDLMKDQTQLSAYNLSASVPYPEVLTQLSSKFEELRGRYAIADSTVSLQQVAGKLGYDDTDVVTDEEMAMEVLKELEKLTRVKKMMEAAAKPF